MLKQKRNQVYLLFAVAVALIVVVMLLNIDLPLKVGLIVLLTALGWFGARQIYKKPKRVNLVVQDYSKLARDLMTHLGGKTNVVGVDHCQTRVLLTVNDSKLADVESIRKLGISGVLKPSNTKVQLIVKELVEPVSDALKKELAA